MFFSIQLSVSFLYSVFNEHSRRPPLRSYLTVFPKVQSTSFANSFRPSKVKGILAAGPTGWWAQVDSNHRPPAYQAGALTS